jgi:hypothetical protein
LKYFLLLSTSLTKSKAKVQLLLKKMKSSHDISWNEKEELKYKGETVQGSKEARKQRGGFSQRRAEQKEIFQPIAFRLKFTQSSITGGS